VKFGGAVFETNEWTNKQTDTQITIHHTPTGGEVTVDAPPGK